MKYIYLFMNIMVLSTNRFPVFFNACSSYKNNYNLMNNQLVFSRRNKIYKMFQL